jgi:hypothetical protein
MRTKLALEGCAGGYDGVAFACWRRQAQVGRSAGAWAQIQWIRTPPTRPWKSFNCFMILFIKTISTDPSTRTDSGFGSGGLSQLTSSYRQNLHILKYLADPTRWGVHVSTHSPSSVAFSVDPKWVVQLHFFCFLSWQFAGSASSNTK